ncbi:MAG: hypothetical protein WC414_03090 [Patescibacteria group bacterium]
MLGEKMKRFVSFICFLLFFAFIFLGIIGLEAKISQNWKESSVSFSHSFFCLVVFYILKLISNFFIKQKEKKGDCHEN